MSDSESEYTNNSVYYWEGRVHIGGYAAYSPPSSPRSNSWDTTEKPKTQAELNQMILDEITFYK